MPFAWTIPPDPPVLPIQEQVRKPALGDFGDELQVTGKVVEIDPIREIIVYTDRVAAKFGPTMVFADRLEVHGAAADRYAIARGNVRIEDPEGEFKAASFVFWFGDKKGPDGQIATADRIELELGGVSAKAESAIIRPDRWEFLNVEGTNCKQPIPLFYLRSKKVVIVPGRNGTAYSPRISIFGKEIGTLPTRRFSLDRRSPGIQVPSISYKKGSGFGVSWSSGLLLDDQSIVMASFSSFPKETPSYGVTYAKSFIPADASTAKIAARSELLERFSWSYFDDIRVGTILTSRSFANKLRNSITAQTIWNTGSSARIEGEDFNKAIDVAYERGGPVGNFGLYWQARAQSIQRNSEDFVERGVAYASLQAPAIQLARGLQTDIRFDAYGVAGEKGSFGWGRAQTGILYQPIPQVALGAAWISGFEAGKPNFLADQLVSRNAAHLRADINLGPTKISYLAKFDFNRKKWYDQEYSISQVVGCLEPYLIRREFPRDYALGVRFRMNDFLGILERRKPVRTKPTSPPSQTISALPSKP
ncbi:MAG: hypothetical protein H7Y17_02250 [Chlorobia bacterium]|nr:hypothetical protein [Fimbriimonadaceae bacterium]